jgi:signal peptidase I
VTKSHKPLARSAVELVVIIATALGLALAIQAFIVKPYEIPSGSMEPTLIPGQRVLVDRIGSHFSSPTVGNIVVFHPPVSESCANGRQGANSNGQQWPEACDSPQTQHSSQNYIKRVVGLPGDHLKIINGHVYRNGKKETDGYAQPCQGGGECNFPQTLTVPKGDYYMMGDNRPDSLDSRYWGPVPKAWIIGKAFMTYWPLDRIGIL